MSGAEAECGDTQVVAECAAEESDSADWERCKATGDEHTTSQQWKTAIDCYDEALKTVPADPPELAGSLWACRARCNAEVSSNTIATDCLNVATRCSDQLEHCHHCPNSSSGCCYSTSLL